jgi:thiol-disulfide isomerase/thioredoxin
MGQPESRDTSATKPRRRWGWLINLFLILACFLIIHTWRAEPMASGNAPALTGKLTGAGEFDLGALRGRPVLVHFWATWCPVCRLGDDGVDAVAEDFDVITVAMESGGATEINRHLAREGLSFPVIADPYGEIARRWGVPGVPASFVVDGTGRIRFATVGHTTETGLRGRLWAARRLD